MPDAAPIILACASPPGRSARALIRVSGDDLMPLAEALCHPPPSDRRLQPTRIELSNHEPHPRPALAGKPLPDDPSDATALSSRSRPVPGLAAFFAAPHSFTGEDVLELQVPGNPILVERLLRAVVARAASLGRSARPAEAGEFTRRAFTAGRIDLTRAEGIAATVSARSDAELQAARLLRRGRLGKWAETLVDRLANLLALVEAGIDFVDQDDVVAITPASLLDGLDEIERELNAMCERSRSWSEIEALPWVVLVGPPNAGKSTLFNALLGRERAVASGIAGTTRDVLTEPMRIELDRGAAELMLVDIAGLDEPGAALDEAVQQAAHGAIERAELLLLIDDGEDRPTGALLEAAAITAKQRLTVQTKCDRFRDSGAEFHVSARTGEGLAALRSAIASRVADRAVALGGELLALQPRHQAAIEAAARSVCRAKAQLEPDREEPDVRAPELTAAAMREALDELGAVGGRLTPDEVIGRVFATFCIGK